MPVPREAVEYAYRYLLNREPENEKAIHDTQQATDWGAIRSAFIGSMEFRKRELPQFIGGAERIGRHLEVDFIRGDFTATESELQELLNSIAASWIQFGEEEPHWSVITNPVFKKDNLHQNLDGFFAHGRSDVEMMLKYVTRGGRALDFERAMDFGCGVGRMTIPLAEKAASVVGVDISPGHLREAKEACERRGVKNVDLVQISKVEHIDDLGDFDLILSRIVLQHNPPPVMAEIYRRLLRQLRPGGVAVIQMPTFIVGQCFSIDGYFNGPLERMEMNALPQREIFRIIAEEGCLTLEVREDDHLGEVDGLSHTFAVMRP